MPQLAGWAVSQVTTVVSARLADLRDPALAALEVRPEQLTMAGPVHYRCTGQLAAALHAAGFDGAVWHSRQAGLYRARVRQQGGLARTLLTHAPVEAFVFWVEPGRTLFLPGGNPPRRLLDGGRPDPLVVDLAALLGLHLELG